MPHLRNSVAGLRHAVAVAALLIVAAALSGPPHGAAAAVRAEHSDNASAAARRAESTGARQQSAAKGCPKDATGLKLPPGFCATIFADEIGHARHLVVAPDGVVYVNTWSGAYYANDKPHAGGFLVALQDTKGTGHADVNQRFGATVESGGTGGTGIGIYQGHLYAESNDRIVRYALRAGSVVPQGEPEVIVSGLPLGGDHPMHPFAIDADGMMYVDVASATNSCQEKNRVRESPGIQPCKELETRAGIWRYDANRSGQRFSARERYATGIRNADGIAVDPSGHGLYATQHGRDQLAQNWPDLYRPPQEAVLPAEELLRVRQGGDYGWPECYYDEFQGKLVLAPEYGGDGGKAVGVCASKIAPVAAFPAHWAPDGLALASGASLPAHYRSGAFIAFHGSWNRAPFPQGGYNVAFVPLAAGAASGQCEIFADGFAGAQKEPGKAPHRPTGIALGPDGAVFVSDDVRGRIYRIAYGGSSSTDDSAVTTPCPKDDPSAGGSVGSNAAPPEGTHPNAGTIENLPVPPGATRQMLALGAQVFSGQTGGAPCAGCHGSDGTGTPLGPDLASRKRLWSDGSLDGIRRTITNGVPTPKQYRDPMPPMGGAQLTPEQLAAVSAYVWALGHRGAH